MYKRQVEEYWTFYCFYFAVWDQLTDGRLQINEESDQKQSKSWSCPLETPRSESCEFLKFWQVNLSVYRLFFSAKEVGILLSEPEWLNFLYWHFHSYKMNINRSDFMRILNIHDKRKRATSACKIDQFKIDQKIYQRAEEDRLRTLRIEEAVK